MAYRKSGDGDVAVVVTPDAFQLIPRVNEDCTIQLSNVSFEAIMFRVLTTSPAKYAVKSTKGVIRPNSTATVTIVLNAEVRENCVDDFKLEYCVLGPDDVVEPRCANVPALIRARKDAKLPVHKKLIRCRVMLTEPPPRNPAPAAALSEEADPAGAGAGRKLEQTELERNTLAEKNRRNQVAQMKAHRKRTLTLAIAAIVVGVALWFSVFGY